jgi:DNA-binding MarR family transcriptional regulator
MDNDAPRPVPLSAEEEAMLRALGRVMSRLARVVDADMVREQHLPLSEYTTLQVLSEAPGRQMRMNALATACNLSFSGISRIVQRLESLGFVQRVRCVEDARGFNAVLTDAGLLRLQQAWPSNLASVRRHVFAHLEGIDLTQVRRALERIADAD